MADLKKVYFGDVGPFYYDADQAIDDPDGDFTGQDQEALTGEGQISLGEEATEDTHIPRLEDTKRYALLSSRPHGTKQSDLTLASVLELSKRYILLVRY